MNRPAHFVWREWQFLWLTAAVTFSLAVSQANAQQLGKRVGPEVAVGGMTTAQRVAKKNKLRAELAAQMPAGTLDTPVRVVLTAEERASLSVQPIANGHAPLRIGMTKSFTPDIEKAKGTAFRPDMPGKFLETPDGGLTWAISVSSPGAQAIRVRFKNFSLPPGSELYFYNVNGAAHGPYVAKGRKGNGDFWTRSISSDTGVIQLRVPGDVDRRTISFAISELAHISGRVSDDEPTDAARMHDTWPCAGNVSCLVDANCVNGTPADPAKDAVAKMEWISGPSVFTCSGGLLADTVATSQIPYFLTANHCLNSSIANLETWFDYTTSACNGDCPHNLFTGGAPPSDTIGLTVLRSGTAGDYTLGTLDQAPPAGAVFLGWNSTPIAFSNGAHLYRISNANYGPQVYTQHDVSTTTPTCGGIPRGNWIYSYDITGAFMGGSSGAPVVNGSSEVVGQLTGCCGTNCGNECLGPPSNATIDGAFASYFSQVDDLLDPPPVCTTDPDCDDSDLCTTDQCVSGSCLHTPLNCPPGEICVAGACVPLGACCAAQLCSIVTAADCSAAGGSYVGDGTDCGSGEAGNPTVYQNSPGLAIPDGGGSGNPAVDTITVTDAFIVGDVDVDLSVTHTWVGDLTVILTHLGTTVTVLDQPGVPLSQFGCGNDNYNDIILDDEGGGGPIEDACAANLSSPPNYTPNNPLSAFDGMNAAGDWVINIYDNVSQDSGTLNQWSVHIDQTASNPCTDVCLTDPDCDDENVCTDETCNAGTCEYTNTSSPCDDLLFCNGADTCSGGSCSIHTGDPCAGGGECKDTCNEGVQTCHTPAGTPCTDDGNLCTDNECDGAGTCAANGNTNTCDDGDACTTGDACQGDPLGTCAGTFADSDGDGVCDANDICPGGDDTVDSDGDGIPDACDIESPVLAPSPHDILKNRYISIDPRGAMGINVGKDLDIRATLTSTLVNGVTAINSEWWANAPNADCISMVTPTRPATPPNWDACPVLHLTGCPILPTSSYFIAVVDGSTVSDPPLVAQTQALPGGNKWFGDVVGSFDPVADQWSPPDGLVTINDAVAAIKTFQNPTRVGPGCGTPPCNATHISVTDIHPAGFPLEPWGTPNQVVDINDVFAIILGFQGNEFPGPAIEMCPDL